MKMTITKKDMEMFNKGKGMEAILDASVALGASAQEIAKINPEVSFEEIKDMIVKAYAGINHVTVVENTVDSITIEIDSEAFKLFSELAAESSEIVVAFMPAVKFALTKAKAMAAKVTNFFFKKNK
jgi:N-acetyl-gamma-glutamylphosphate reductase